MTRTPLTDRPGTLGPLMWLSLPVLAEQILHLLVGLADLTLTGNYLPGESYVAAMTLVLYLLWLIGMLFSFVATGATPMVARMVGAKRPEEANDSMHQSLVLGLVLSLLIMVAGHIALVPLVSLLGLEGEAAQAAIDYLRIELMVVPAIMVERVGAACLRGAGDTVSGLGIMVAVNIVNIGVSYSLVTGAGGLPQLGWEGIAIGTAAGHMTGASIMLALLLGGRAGFHLRWAMLWPHLDMMRRILWIGIPGGIDAVLLVLCNLTYLSIVLRLGDVAAAAHGVAIQVESLAYLPGGAFAIAASTLTGQFLGAGDLERARRSGWVAAAAASALMVSAGIGFLIWAEPLIGFFLGDHPEVLPVAAKLLRLIAWAMLPLAMSMVLSGALRGAGDTRWPIVSTLVGLCLIRIPLAIYLSQESFTLPLTEYTIQGAGWGVAGAWCGAVADIVIRCAVLLARYVHGGWLHTKV